MPEFKTNKNKRWLIERPHSSESTNTFKIGEIFINKWNLDNKARPFHGELHSGKWFATWK